MSSVSTAAVNLVCSIYDLCKYDISLSLLSKLQDDDEEWQFNESMLLWTS